MIDSEGEAAIRALADGFADAINRRAAADVSRLFTVEGQWLISETMQARGRSEITEAADRLLGYSPWVVQLLHSGTVCVTEGTATARWYLSEWARSRSGRGVHRIGVYSDQLAHTDEGWRFARRDFTTILQRPVEAAEWVTAVLP